MAAEASPESASDVSAIVRPGCLVIVQTRFRE